MKKGYPILKARSCAKYRLEKDVAYKLNSSGKKSSFMILIPRAEVRVALRRLLGLSSVPSGGELTIRVFARYWYNDFNLSFVYKNEAPVGIRVGCNVFNKTESRKLLRWAGLSPRLLK